MGRAGITAIILFYLSCELRESLRINSIPSMEVTPTSSSIIRDSDVSSSVPVGAIEESHGPIELVNQVSTIFFFVLVILYVFLFVFSAIRRKYPLKRRD